MGEGSAVNRRAPLATAAGVDSHHVPHHSTSGGYAQGAQKPSRLVPTHDPFKGQHSLLRSALGWLRFCLSSPTSVSPSAPPCFLPLPSQALTSNKHLSVFWRTQPVMLGLLLLIHPPTKIQSLFLNTQFNHVISLLNVTFFSTSRCQIYSSSLSLYNSSPTFF